MALALVLGAATYLLVPRTERAPRLANPIQVTSALGAEGYPSWSPEAGRLAYELDPASDRQDFDIWITQFGAGQPVNITQDHEGNDRFPSWSPDGRWIAFWSDREGGNYYIIPALGGTPRKLHLENVTFWSRPQWSSDGKSIALVHYDEEVPFVEVISIDTGERRVTASPRIPLRVTGGDEPVQLLPSLLGHGDHEEAPAIGRDIRRPADYQCDIRAIHIGLPHPEPVTGRNTSAGGKRLPAQSGP